MKKTKELTLISLLAVIIAITGSFKIPGPIPGTEFQLSAPIAVAIAACFGFRRYFLAGIIASGITLILGTHTIINVIISLTFRVVAGCIIHFFKPKFITVTIAGPIGSIAARVVLWLFFGKSIVVMLMAGVPGMIYTALTAWIFTKLLEKIINYTTWREIPNEGSPL